MRIIAVTLSLLSVIMISLTMKAGLRAAHGQEFFLPHLYWGFAALGIVLITLTLCLMFIFKMYGMIEELSKHE